MLLSLYSYYLFVVVILRLLLLLLLFFIIIVIAAGVVDLTVVSYGCIIVYTRLPTAFITVKYIITTSPGFTCDYPIDPIKDYVSGSPMNFSRERVQHSLISFFYLVSARGHDTHEYYILYTLSSKD